MVRKGDFIALIENPARFEDVMLIKSLELFTTKPTRTSAAKLTATQSTATSVLQLGEIQPYYQQYIKACQNFLYFFQADYHQKKINKIEKQIKTQNLILQKSKKQLYISSLQLATAYQIFAMDSALYAKNALSSAEYQNAKNTYLQQLQSYENAELSIDNQYMNILQAEQAIFDLEEQENEQYKQLQIALISAYGELQTQIKIYEQNYLLVSPIDGIVTLTKYWQKNQNINAGEVLLTVVPNEQEKIVGKILLPAQGAGKVRIGQTVNVKFDNFPYMEFGMVQVQIKNISLVPVAVENNQKSYILEVEFPNKLKTNYGKELSFIQEMTGSVEIITEDLRLLDKFLNPIKAILKK